MNDTTNHRMQDAYDHCAVGQEASLRALDTETDGLDALASELAHARQLERSGLVKVTFRRLLNGQTEQFRFQRLL